MRAGVVVGVVAVLAVARIASADIAIEKVGVHVAAKKTNGDKWDRSPGSEPDPKIAVRVNGELVVTCHTASDRFETDCAVGSKAFDDGSTVELHVVDEDLVNDDEIGNARGPVSDRPDRQDLGVDGALESAWVEVTHRDPPSFWSTLPARIGARGIGLVFGVAIAFLVFRLMGATFLTPKSSGGPLKREVAKTDEKDPEPSVRFWRSPILLASAGASVIGGLLAVALRDPKLSLAIASVPYVFGGFALVTPIIDAHAHERLGQKRARLIIAALAAMLAVPIFDAIAGFASALGFVAHHMGFTMVFILLLLLL